VGTPRSRAVGAAYWLRRSRILVGGVLWLSGLLTCADQNCQTP
jgi:hypothetical protein